MRYIYIAWVLLLILVSAAGAQSFSLGTTNLLEGPATGSDSVMIEAGGAWAATTNVNWLHLSDGNQSGTGSTNVIFTFDANPGATRSGTLTIAGQTLTVTQAGSTYVAVTNVVTLVSSGLHYPSGVAVDSAGNVYIADTDHGAIKEWIATSNNVITLVPSGLFMPIGLAVDGAENVYIADTSRSAIRELPHAFVDPTTKTEMAVAGSDVLPVVLPVTANLTGPFAPVSDSIWLTITGVTNGGVSFAFTATATNRTAHIALLGQSIAVTQPAVTAPILTGFTFLNNGAFQFGFTNNQGASFTILTTTNLSWPLTNWTVIGSLTNNGTGQYQFTDPAATNNGQRFYRVSSP